MRTRKTQTGTETPSEQRLRQVAQALGLGRELPQAWVAQRAGIPRSTLQNAAIRDRLSYELARKIARLMVGDEEKLVAWLRGETLDAPDGAAMVPRMPLDERSGRGGTPGGARQPAMRVVEVDSGLRAWLELGRDMQHNLAVKVIKEALEAQDFAGSPVLRALHGIAEKMNEMGYTAMSRHIWAEMGRYFGHQIPPDQGP